MSDNCDLTNIKRIEESMPSLDSWTVPTNCNGKNIFKNKQKRNNSPQLKISDTSSLSSSSGSWFEPLENIISSGSNSSNSSPSDNSNELNMNDVDIKLESSITDANSNQFLINGYNMKKENDENFPDLPDFNTFLRNDNSIVDLNVSLDSKKRRAPRKRLTSHQKQAHNKIEKRYRININTKIAKLQQIIPWVANEQTAFEVSDSASKGKGSPPSQDDTISLSNGANNSTKLNKSMILEKAVDYILYLQNNERLYEMEVQRLKSELQSLKN
ncbi:hypothetical protein Kpol_367p10 [Vanderwaltozyma polyspora DSM 70294]|uniref:BHLH domain-containing protein n=1 Tax=Vanderwaltozyma polyspora (strain ATCC 22028 / DSM 70294 / BCRC 21397 / CBS 2163 / NBRC 10782 / NRRL Y-8283 / UCD 57-17) TaxID=436907 RepID=A7TRR1_VANPO|nr:uncharacterized protein Kpol_367p10 [Vanderwaltozyma polyspora DSM 70294]EDO15055.1 hypothetical protein Kpol_367p10 [Vanderwaltozyma polyspora DSM 70294]